MKITWRIQEDVCILDLDGRLVIGDGDIQLREDVDKLLGEKREKILINLNGVKQMDSSGLGELMRAQGEAERHGSVIKLLHVEDKVQRILRMTQLIGVFETFDDEAEALASFRA